MPDIFDPVEQTCPLCSKCVVITIAGTGDDFIDGTFKSDCEDVDCPINKDNQNDSDSHITVSFCDDDDDE